MKPAPFEYADPTKLRELCELLAARAPDAKLLAGGQSLMPVLNMRLSRTDLLIDLNRVDELKYIEGSDGSLRLGSLVRHDSLMRSIEVSEKAPLVQRAIPYIGHSAIRYRGTVGGSLVHADPAAELPAVMVALGAELVLTGAGGSRTISADDFFVTFLTTAIEPDEVLTEIRLPRSAPGAGVAVAELARRHGDFALAGIVTMLSREGGRVSDASLCAFGVDEVPRRLTEAESVVTGNELTDDILVEAATRAKDSVAPESDMHASADYRREMTGVLTRRALRDAFNDCS